MSESKPNDVLVPRPLTPRPKLFVSLLVIFLAWVGFMVWMYVATVYPVRHEAKPAGAPIAPRAESR